MARTLRTALTELVGCTVPIQQAGMGPLANPDLAEAVANAGGQGMVSVHWMPEDVLAPMLDDPRRRTPGGVGCDFLVAQGIEAGGHVRGQSTLLALLDAVLPEVSVPVLAAGGIATGRDLAAVLAAGASGARVGTRLPAAGRAGGPPLHS